MEPVGHSPLPEFPPFDAAVLAGWLDAPVAMLSQPPGLIHYASNQSHSIGHAPQIPVAVTVQHRFDSGDPFAPEPAVMANVRTRLRQARGEPEATTVRQTVAEAVREFMEDSAVRAGVSLRPGNRPPELDEHLRRDLEGWSTRPVLVDGVTPSWEYVTVSDYATAEEIIAVGGQSGDVLVAVVGPAALLDQVELRLVQPH